MKNKHRNTSGLIWQAIQIQLFNFENKIYIQMLSVSNFHPKKKKKRKKGYNFKTVLKTRNEKADSPTFLSDYTQIIAKTTTVS